MQHQLKIPINEVVEISDKIMMSVDGEIDSIKVLMGMLLSIEFMKDQLNITDSQYNELKDQCSDIVSETIYSYENFKPAAPSPGP